LVQRLGRCHRHPRDPRQDWCSVPTIVVLDPINTAADPPCPPEWTAIYSEYELLATHRVLAARNPQFRVPDDVDPLIQQVHNLAPPDLDDPDAELWAEHYGSTRAQAALASFVAIPRPGQVSNLAALTHPDIADTDASTRLGVDTARIIPRYTSADGRHWLNREHTAPFPSKRLKSQQVKRVIQYSINAPASYARQLAPAPETWSRTMLRNARILDAPTDGTLTLDPELGLIKDA
jgi:CRISPR-associated endonuclease/helicase Cas3